MAAFRSRRLESLLETSVADASYQQVVNLVGVEEYTDLDFKREAYENTEGGRKSLATDVAAMANTAGGLLVLGMHEDDQARATGPSGMAVSDGEVSRMRSVVASKVHSTPAVDIRIVENPEVPGTGFFLIAVPRSPMGPHAVVTDQSMRFPRRNGATTIYLSEPDVAQAYRERFAGLQNRLDDAAAHEAYLLSRLEPGPRYVVVTLVPDLDGYAPVDQDLVEAFQAAVVGESPQVIFKDWRWTRVLVGPGYLIADTSGPAAPELAGIACALHHTGAGTYATHVSNDPAVQTSDDVVDDRLTAAVIGALRFLARHARDRAATGGNATLRATVFPVDEPPSAGPRLVQRWAAPGAPPNPAGAWAGSPPVATAVGDIDALADDGPALLAATHTLVTGLVQHVGVPEARQVTRSGEIRPSAWPTDRQRLVREWAQANGAGTVEA